MKNSILHIFTNPVIITATLIMPGKLKVLALNMMIT